MKIDYTGKTVFVGIDVHKKTYVIHCICGKATVKKWSMCADSEQLIQQLTNNFKGAQIQSAYEAGFSGFVLHRKLIAAGIRNRVINPGSIEVASRDRVKTDKRDAKKLAQQLADGRLTSVYVPSEEEELSRLLTRHRAMLVKDRARSVCRLKSKLMQFGYWGACDEYRASKRWVTRLRAETYPEELTFIVNELTETWLTLTKKIQALDKKITEHTASHDKIGALELIYRSAPGIGNVSSNELCRELGNLQQFSNNKQAYSYTGLTPTESSSGEGRRQGHISHCGKPRLRGLLIEIAWRSIKLDPSLFEKFDRIARTKGKKRSIVAIARTLVGRLRACLQSGELYEVTMLSEAQAQVR